MNTQATFNTNESFKFGLHNRFFVNHLVPRIALHLVLNTWFIPNALITKLFMKTDHNDSQVLEHPKLDSRMLTYVGVKIDLAQNMQILFKEFFNNDVTTNKNSHPFNFVLSDFKPEPTTVIRRKFDRNSDMYIIDDWKDAVPEKTMMVNEFFILWPFYRLSLKFMKNPVNYEERLSGTSGDTLRKLVKSFDMEKLGYPVHMTGEKYLK